jgi:hypothetical protein
MGGAARQEGERRCSWMEPTDGGFPRDPLDLGVEGEIWRPPHFKSLNREPAGVSFFFTSPSKSRVGSLIEDLLNLL